MQPYAWTIVAARHDCCLGRSASNPLVVRAMQLAERFLGRSSDVQLDVPTDLFAGDVIMVRAKQRAGAQPLVNGRHLDDEPSITRLMEALPGSRHAVLSANAPGDDVLQPRDVDSIGVAPAHKSAWPERVKRAGCVQVAAGHLDFDFS